MIVKLLTEHHLEFLSLKGGCTGSSESTHVNMPHCWKSHVTAQLCLPFQCLVCELNNLLLSTHKRQSLCQIIAPSVKNKSVLVTIFNICDIDLGLQGHISNF